MQLALDRGEAISDELYLRMITTKLRSLFPDHDPARRKTLQKTEGEKGVPEDPVVDFEDGLGILEPSGWIVVGFPETLQQYALLERYLSGWVSSDQRPPAKAAEEVGK